MKNILCYGDSNTWGNIAGTRNRELMLVKRFPRGVRWTSVLQQLLGNDYYVIEAGLNGRNTSFDETRFNRPSRNGLATLPLLLEMNYPLDLVILALGTNDALIDFNASPEHTRDAMQKMIRIVKNSHFGHDFKAPEILLIAPPAIMKIDSAEFNLFFDDNSISKIKQLPKLYQELATQEGCHFVDAGPVVKISAIDGVHYESDGHQALANMLTEKITTILG